MGDEPIPMKPASPEQVLFAQALQCAAPEARAAYLEGACGADAALRQRVEVLLRAAANAGDFLEEPPTGLSGDADSTRLVPELISEKPGDRIGRYKLLEKIGEGGCGVVYMAEQEEPVRRRVALKVIKLGMDTQQVIARFEAERQALALMDHPNIAKVFDGGATPTGRPYFVMELVRGVRITQFCDEARLSTEARLRLFVLVCQAVQHAHQKGIIHRDLKPSNILVTVNDGAPVPKVIDFGIAKATGQRLTDKSLFTQFHSFIGTPAYTSPEQAEMSSVDIDTRSDIYSLGVLLYELLTGQTPFDGEQMLRSGLDEMRRILREQEPVRPLTRLSTLGIAEATELSRKRQIKIPELTSAMQGDLDWIVMKCIEKDRSRRYETASGLAMDIRRFLGNEPILARPPSTAYRLQKAFRRNKLAFAATGAVVVALMLGVIISAWQAVRATRAKAAAVVEKQRAAEQASIATSITKYLQQMLGSADPGAAKGLDYTVRQLLDDYADDLEKQLPNQPEVEATLQSTIGRAYSCLGQHAKARKHLMRALVLRRDAFGDKHEKYADSLVDYAWTAVNDRSEGEADLRQALAIYRAHDVGGEPLIRALRTLQWILIEQAYAGVPGKWNEIEMVSKKAMAEARRSPGIEFPDIAHILGGLVHAKIFQSQYAEAEKIARESLAMRLRLNGPEHHETAWGYHVLGDALRAERQFSEAIQAEKQALAIMRKAFPPEHRNIAVALTAVIRTLDMADNLHALADLSPSLGELESVFREVVTTTKPSQFNPVDPLLVAVCGLARFNEFYLHLSHELASAGKTKEAAESRANAIRLLESLQTQLVASPDLLPYLYSYRAVALTKAGQPQQAKELCRKLLDRVTPRTSGAHNNVAWFLATAEVPAHRDPALAIELAQKAVESDPQSHNYRNTLGIARYRAGDWKQAISDLEESISLGKGGNSFDFFFLAMAHWKLGDKVVAREWFKRAIPSMDEQQPNEELRRFQTEAEELMKESPVK